MEAQTASTSTIFLLNPAKSSSLDQSPGVSDDEPHESQTFDCGHLALVVEKETLETLYNRIQERSDMERPVTPDLFSEVLEHHTYMQKKTALDMFDRIDWASLKGVSWREFCAFMSGECKVRYSRFVQARVIEFVMPPHLGFLPHRDHPTKVLQTNDGLWITVSTESTIALWNHDARLKRHRICMSKQRMKKKLERKWITDAALMTEFSKVILTTGDREIQFYDMASFSPFCQISGFETVPICIAYKTLNRERCLLLYGDQMGCVSVLIFNCMLKSFRLWKKLHKHENFIPSIPIEQAIVDNHISFMRWQVHKDWVAKVQYCQQTDKIFSCSKDPDASLVIGNRRGSTNISKLRREGDPRMKKPLGALYGCTRPRNPDDQRVYCLTRGIIAFDYSYELKIVATGGADRTIRLWNCYLTDKPLAILPGHYDIIKALHLEPSKDRLFSASADRWIKVWDVYEHVCLLTLSAHDHLVTGELRAFHFSALTNSVAIVGDSSIAVLRIKLETEVTVSRSHKEPVNCVLYNPHFNQVISACRGSTVKVWNLDTGRKLVEFHNAHDHAAIAHMTLDTTNKRLITVATDGTTKMWHYNTGLCVRTMQPDKDSLELTTVTYVDMRNVKYILTGGWSRKLNFYIDDTPETIPFVIPLLPQLRDSPVRGHQSDILCSDFSMRDRVATGDSSGVVHVWNSETNHRSNVLTPPVPQGWSKEKLEDDKMVACVHFLKARSRQRRWGNLVVGGPYGQIVIWNVNFTSYGHTPVAVFPVSDDNTDSQVVSVCAMDSDVNDTLLVTADSKGYIALWSLKNYAMDITEKSPPEQLIKWLGHIELITSVKLVCRPRLHDPGSSFTLVVSSALDHTVRLWNDRGHFIGTFGQHYKWDVHLEGTYRHPEIPRDIEEMFERDSQQDSSKGTEASDEKEDLLAMRKDRGQYTAGLEYFARLKKKECKKGRHLNDETFTLYSSTGHVVPHQNLRCHELQKPPSINDVKPPPSKHTNILDF